VDAVTAVLRAEVGACQGCGACLLTCPQRALRPGRAPGRPLLVLASCDGCGECVEVCPVDAVRLVPAARTGGEDA
jgi:NAD-dependent dihydropyrimidine dehydrogenase PreA subunit